MQTISLKLVIEYDATGKFDFGTRKLNKPNIVQLQIGSFFYFLLDLCLIYNRSKEGLFIH